MTNIFTVKKLEELKRDRAWPLADRWRVVQETIAWADAQQHPPRNSAAACVEHQKRLLARFERMADGIEE
jgi:hypothetical protein